MKEILVNSNNTFFKNLIGYYETYIKYQELYNSKYPKLKFIENKQGIPFISAYNGKETYNLESNVIGLVLDEGVYAIKDEIADYNKNKKYIILAFGDWDKKEYNFPINYDLITWHYWLDDYRSNISFPGHINLHVNKNYNFDNKKENLFCAYAFDRSPIRNLMIDKLLSNFKNKKCSLRYNGKQLLGESHLDPIHNYKQDVTNYDSNFFYSVDRLIPIDLFNTCNIHLVIETSIENINSFTLSEKTLKPLLTGIPFVILATPGFLKTLRSLGFRTFNSLWSEDYDEIVNHESRIDAIISLIKKLEHFDWIKNKQEFLDIAQHNRINFVYNTKHIQDTFNQLENIFYNLE